MGLCIPPLQAFYFRFIAGGGSGTFGYGYIRCIRSNSASFSLSDSTVLPSTIRASIPGKLPTVRHAKHIMK
jgi:hypothetical protein